MDADLFDAWTRRRFGTAAAGAVVGLLAVAGIEPGRARAKRRRHRRRRCEKLGTRCNPNNDRQLCCRPFFCQIVPELGGHRCCKTLHLPCSGAAECCGNLVCAGEGNARSCRTGP